MKKRSLIPCGLADIGHRQLEQDLGTGLALEAVKEKVPEAAGSRRVDGNPGMEKVCPNEKPGW